MATKFSWKIFARKVALNALAVTIAGGVSVWQNNAWWLALLPILKGVNNMLKHKWGMDIKIGQ